MRKTFKLDGLDCANCAAKIETAMGKMAGVSAASVNFMSCKMVLEVEESRGASIEQEARKLMRKLEPDVDMVAI